MGNRQTMKEDGLYEIIELEFEMMFEPRVHFRPKDFGIDDELVPMLSKDYTEFVQEFGEPTDYTYREWEKRMIILKL